jgi:pimeloyl-ACP methyl ester carboxylesterase
MMRLANVWVAAAFGGCMLAATVTVAQDYAREKRWADEIVPAIVVGDAVQLRATSGRDFLGILTPGKPNRPALVLVHGVGVHPDHGVIGILRAKLADLGYTTLSIQMPVASREATVDDYYPKVFPDAADRLHKAGEWLKAKGHANVVLISHSMGAWMANEYLDKRHADTPYRAWVVMGLTGGYSWTMRRYKFPILDVYGENDLVPVLKAEGRRISALDSSNGSRQVKIAGADHHYDKHETALTAAIDAFLRDTVAK